MRQLVLSLTKKDFEVSYFSGSGGGGQHRNKHQNCVRIRHDPSGAMAVGQDGKSKDQNKKAAFKRLNETKKFKDWLKIKLSESYMDECALNEKVDRMMCPENLLLEYA